MSGRRGEGPLPGGVQRMLRIRNVRREVDEELRFHFERSVEELMARGMNRPEAEQAAGQRFGDVARYRRELVAIDERAAGVLRWRDRLAALGSSLRYALHSLRRTPAFAVGVVLAFALGIGANGVMYRIVQKLLLEPPAHVVAPDQVRRVYEDVYVAFVHRRIHQQAGNYPDLLDMKQARTLAGIAAYTARRITIGRGTDAHELKATWATASFFPLLGVRPALGRFYDEREDEVGGEQVVVLGWNEWQREYGGARDVLGRSIDFGYGPYTIIGVAPRGFTGVDLGQVDVWLPMLTVAAQTMGRDWLESRDWWFFGSVVRLKPDASLAQAETELTALHRRGRQPEIAAGDYDAGVRVELTPLSEARGPEPPGEGAVARLLLVVSFVVLLIAALNVANLLLARGLTQRRELAVRLALGISRRRLIGQITLEALLLSLAGGAAAVVLSFWGTRILGRVLLPGVAWDTVGVSWQLLLVILALSLLAGLLSGLIPAVQASRGELQDMLRQAGAGGVTRTTSRLRAGLVVAQTALSVLLLVGAGLFIRSLRQVRNADLGFDARQVLYVTPHAPRNALSEADELRVFRAAEAQVAALPGVEAVGMSNAAPFSSSYGARVRAEGVDTIRTPATGGPYVTAISPGFLRAMGLEIRQGRGITAADVRGAERVAVIGQTMARGIWPQESPLGKCLYVGGKDGESVPCSRIVGVVEDGRRQEVREETTFQYYLSLAQTDLDSVPRQLMVRTAHPTPALQRAIAQSVNRLDGRIRYTDVQLLSDMIEWQLRSWQLGATMFSIFGLLALLVAAIGLYSVLSFDVTQRTRELGVRSALGALRNTLLAMIVRRALGLTALGVTLGIVIALAMAGRVQDMLFEIPPRDPITFIAVVVTLHLVAVVASTLPGWRAALTEPAQALRAE